MPTIGVLTPLVSGPYFGAVLAGIGRVAQRAGAAVVVVQTLDPAVGDTHTGLPATPDAVALDRVDAVVAVTGAARDEDLRAVHARGLPLVLISHAVAGLDVPVVGPDNHAAIREVVDHLVDHGHRRIAFAGFLGQRDFRERHEAYRAALRAHGLPLDDDLLLPTPQTMQAAGDVAAGALLARGLPATAVVVGNDLIALGILRTLADAGVRVPEDVAVVGFDDSPVAESLAVPLASVNQRVDAVGAEATRLALDVLAGRPVAPGYHAVATSLMIRASCGCGDGHLVGLAAAAAAAPADRGRSDRSDGSDTSDGSDRSDASDGDPLAIARRLLPVLAPEGDEETLTELRRRCAEVTEHLMAVAERPDADRAATSAVAATAVALYRHHRRRGTVGLVLAAVQEGVRRIVERSAGRSDEADAAGAGHRLDAVVLAVATHLSDAQAHAKAGEAAHAKSALRDEYDITMELLRGSGPDPTTLHWLRHAPVVAGCLAMWDDERVLRLESTYGEELGALLPAGSGPWAPGVFPPPELGEVASRHPGTQVIVLPLRTTDRDWGLLALVGAPETRCHTGRETYFQWSAMLGVALDHGALVDSLREQRADLTEAWGRERLLTETLGASEQRYALAATAANDALWDWDLTTDELYLAPRWAELLACGEEELGSTPQAWLDRVHPDDAAVVQDAVARCRRGDAAGMQLEHRLRGGDGRYRWTLCRALAVRADDGAAVRLVGSMTDVTERRLLEDQLRHQALYDTLTELPNRVLFLDRLDRAITRATRQDDATFAVLFMDLDGFKVVNDSLGHLAGDLLLTQVAERIRSCVRATDTAARLGGDEFTVLLEDVDLASVPAVARKLQEAIAAPYVVEGTTVGVTATVGVATSATGYTRAADALRDADIAMYRAKSAERGTLAVFDRSMHAGAMSRLRVESALREGLGRDEIALRYQPLVRLADAALVGFEALVRWERPDGEVVLPGDFLPVAEHTGLIVPLGRSVVRQACAQLARWRADVAEPDALRVSVNLSHKEFWRGDLLDHLVHTLREHDVPPRQLTVEITEGVLMHDVEQARARLGALRDLGLQLHVDDFGTGYSSLEALHRFPIDALKIDRSFVARLGTDPRSEELVRTIVTLGAGLGIDVVAEGVETAEQRAVLVALGCTYGQGYLFARPLAAGDASLLLRDGLAPDGTGAHAVAPPALAVPVAAVAAVPAVAAAGPTAS